MNRWTEHEPSNFHESDNFGFFAIAVDSRHTHTHTANLLPLSRHICGFITLTSNGGPNMHCPLALPLPWLHIHIYIWQKYPPSLEIQLFKYNVIVSAAAKHANFSMSLCTKCYTAYFTNLHEERRPYYFFFAARWSHSSARLCVSSLEIETKQIKSFACTRRHTNLN